MIYPQCTSLWNLSVWIVDCFCACKGNCLCMWKSDFYMWKGDHLCTWKSDLLYIWKGNCLCMWKGDCLCMWKGDQLCWSWDQWLMQRGSTVNFHMENSKDLTHFSCMLCLCVDHWSPQCMQRQICLHGKRQLPLCMKRWSPLHVKRQLLLHMKRRLPLLLKPTCRKNEYTQELHVLYMVAGTRKSVQQLITWTNRSDTSFSYDTLWFNYYFWYDHKHHIKEVKVITIIVFPQQ